MKKITHILGLMSIAMLSSCLDKDPLDRFTNDNFWNNENNVSGYANTFYNEFLGYGNNGGTGNFYFKSLSDDQAGRDFDDWSQKGLTTSNATWRNAYKEIRRANIMIENINKMTSMDDATKNHWLGVARLMRGWEYYQLVRMFGNVPYTDRSLDVNDEGILYGPRNNRDEIMNHVLDDLNFASSNIKESSSKTTWSRALANAMKAEVGLYEGTFRKYRKVEDGQPAPDLSGSKTFLEACKTACSAVMSGNFSLNSSYQGNYNSTDLSGNKEMIFYKAYKQSVLTHSLISYTCSSTQISGMTKDAFNAYLFKDGKPMALTVENNTDVPELENNKLSINKLLEVRDKRLSQTIDPILMYEGKGYPRFAGDMEMISSTGYGVCKYDNSSIPTQYRNQTVSNYTHAPLFWLSVIYLNYAEACVELGTITQNDLDQSINLLKDRAELPHLQVNVGFNDPANNHGVSSLIWEIRRERRCELMFDNWTRYWDLIRWHQLDKLDSSKYPSILLGGNVSTDPNCIAAKKGNYLDGSKGKQREFDNKYYLYPIPSGEIDLNPQLKPNNFGW